MWWIRLILTLLAAMVLTGAWIQAKNEGIPGFSSSAWATIILAHAVVVVPVLALVFPP